MYRLIWIDQYQEGNRAYLRHGEELSYEGLREALAKLYPSEELLLAAQRSRQFLILDESSHYESSTHTVRVQCEPVEWGPENITLLTNYPEAP